MKHGESDVRWRTSVCVIGANENRCYSDALFRQAMAPFSLPLDCHLLCTVSGFRFGAWVVLPHTRPEDEHTRTGGLGEPSLPEPVVPPSRMRGELGERRLNASASAKD